MSCYGGCVFGMPRKTTNLPEKCYMDAAEHIGFGYEQVQFILKVQEDASAAIIRRVKVIAYRKVEKLDHFLLVASSLPLDQDSGASVTRIASQRPNTKVILDDELSADGRRRVIILSIDPPLRRGNELGYDIIEPMRPGTIDLLYDQLGKEKENKFSYDVSWPTKNLSVEVILPFQYAPTSEEADVWRGPSRISVEEVAREVQNTLRVDDAFLDESGSLCYKLQLTTNYPSQGFAYALKWVPPDSPIDVSPIDRDLDTDIARGSTSSGTVKSLYLRRQQAELTSRYEILSKRIADLDIDIGRESKFAERQIIQEKRDELFKERERLVSRMTEIEVQLAKGGLDISL